MLVTMAFGIPIILVVTTQMGAPDYSTAVHMSTTSPIFHIDYNEYRHDSQI